MSGINETKAPYMKWVKLWMLRMLLAPTMLHRLLGTQTGLSTEISQLLCIPLATVKNQADCVPQLRKLEALLRKMEIKTRKSNVMLFQNVDKLGNALSLDNAERAILAFFILVENHELMSKVCDFAGAMSTTRLVLWLARVLDISAKEIRKACDPGSALATTGVLGIMPSARFTIPTKVNLSAGLEMLLEWDKYSPDDFLGLHAGVAPTAEYSISDFDYLEKHLTVMLPFLRNAAHNKISGVNVLIYGKPGTGKTELVRAIAGEIKTALYEVNYRSREGQSLETRERMTAYAVAQRVLANRGCMLLFDEIEDVFPCNSIFSAPKPIATKAWINRMLETNPIPTVWVSNEIWQMDKAYLRRFDYVLEMKSPPLEKRVRLLRRHIQDQSVEEPWLEQIASNSEITPGHMQRIGRVLKIAGTDLEVDHATVASNVLAGGLKAMGIRQVLKTDLLDANIYKLSYLNASIPVEGIIEGLTRRSEGRLCLYGPPGTGKTEFAHHLAKQVGLPLIKKRASDILTPWLGETERNLASMFEEATQNDAVLLLDEADSFLRDRAAAQRSWEITQINELLTQMESHRGIFICSTNIIECLDIASLRRFDFKIRFDYLRPEQRQALFLNMLNKFGESASNLEDTISKRLRKLDRLTPGDFAVAQRQSRLQDVKLTPDTLLSALETECALKEQGKKPFLGFCG